MTKINRMDEDDIVEALREHMSEVQGYITEIIGCYDSVSELREARKLLKALALVEIVSTLL